VLTFQKDTRLSKSKRNMADERRYFGGVNKVSDDTADSDSEYSDSGEFEKVSIPCSESASADEADMDTTKSGNVFNSADTKPFCFEVLKPPRVPAASVTAVHAEFCQHTSVKGRDEKSALSSDLINIATNLKQLMVCKKTL